VTPSLLLRHHLDCVRCLCLNDDESVLISGSDDGTVKLWDLSKMANALSLSDSGSARPPIPITFRGHSAAVSCCCVMPNSSTLVTAGFDAKVLGWRLPLSGQVLMDMPSLQSLRLFEMRRHSDIVWDLAPHCSDALVASVSADGSLKVLNVETQQLKSDMAIAGCDTKYIGPTSVEWRGDTLCVGTVSGHLLLFDAHKERLCGAIAPPPSTKGKQGVFSINRLYADDDLNSSLLYAACDDSCVRVLDTRSQRCVASQNVHTDSVTAMAMHSLSSSMVTASHDCMLRVWDWAPNKLQMSCVQVLDPHLTHPHKWEEGILCMAFNNARKWLFSGGADGIKLYTTNL